MKKLIYIIATVVGLTFARADVISSTATIPFYIFNAANHFNLDEALLLAICSVESRCRPHAINHSDGTTAQKEQGIVVKSFGLFQIQPDTATFLGFKRYTFTEKTVMRNHKPRVIKVRVDNIKQLLNPELNSWYAAKYVKHLYSKYHSTPKVISAYNAGHATKVNDEYVLKVLKAYAKIKIDKHLKD